MPVFKTIKVLPLPFFLIPIFMFLYQCGKPSKQTGIPTIWTTTWTTAPQLVEPHNMPPQPGLTGNTLRQRLRVSIGGDSIRLRFSNEFSTSPLTLQSVRIAKAQDSSTINAATRKTVFFDGQESVTIPAQQAVFSDALAFRLEPREDVSITIFYGDTPSDVTGHPGSRTTSFLLAGNHVNKEQFPNAIKTDHWYTINTIEVKAPKGSAAIAILGNSITDGRGSGTNKQNRWPDILSERLLSDSTTAHIAVLNQGVGGNCVTKQCLGPSVLDRFQRDVLDQNAVKWLIILGGVNDIGSTQDSIASAEVAQRLIHAYQQMITHAHAQDIKVYGATILPFGKSFYDTPFHEVARQKVNSWIRASVNFDAVIDFDKAMQDPDHPTQLSDQWHTGDYLHPNEAGYVKMGESISPELFK